MRPKKFTSRDPMLVHQAVFFVVGNSMSIHVSCNCLVSKHHGHISMGPTKNLGESRVLYNNPANHKEQFTPNDYARW